MDLIARNFFYLVPELIIISVMVMLFMIICVITNPGIIPQIIRYYQTDPDLFQIPFQNQKQDDQNQRHVFSLKSIMINTKYCTECHIYRPPRTVHCGICNHCVQKYDHHCPWLSICIGKFNYKYFIGYIFSLTILTFYSFFICMFVTFYTLDYTEIGQSLLRSLGEIIIAPLSLCFAIALLKLLVYHLNLIYLRQTTNENMKEIYENILAQLPFENIYLRYRKPLEINSYYFKIKNYTDDEYMRKGLLQDQMNPYLQYRKNSQTIAINKIRSFDEITQKN